MKLVLVLSIFAFQLLLVYAKADMEIYSTARTTTPLEIILKPHINISGVETTTLKPAPILIGLPLIQTKGIVKGDGFLYIADTGKDANHKEPAKIWKLNPNTKELKILYQGPLLVNAKWLYYRAKTNNQPAELFVSDYGVETIPRHPGTGEGAKVFTIKLDKNGDALSSHVLYEGPPLRSPEGITVVGDSVILADWAAGEKTSLQDREGTFNRGAIFKIPATGGEPVKLFTEHTWVTLIGSCRYIDEDGKQYIRFIDIDSGRPDDSETRELPQSGTVEFYRTRILSESPLTLGTLERVIINERSIVPIHITDTNPNDKLLFEPLDESKIIPHAKLYSGIKADELTSENIELEVESDTSTKNIRVKVSIVRDGNNIKSQIIDIKKKLGAASLLNNKHGGRVGDSLIQIPRLTATADGTTKGVYLLPPNGGLPATVWRGPPFEQPMGVQYSWDGQLLWITDQAAGPDGTAAIFEVQLPSIAERLNLFPQMKTQHEIE